MSHANLLLLILNQNSYLRRWFFRSSYFVTLSSWVLGFVEIAGILNMWNKGKNGLTWLFKTFCLVIVLYVKDIHMAYLHVNFRYLFAKLSAAFEESRDWPWYVAIYLTIRQNKFFCFFGRFPSNLELMVFFRNKFNH